MGSPSVLFMFVTIAVIGLSSEADKPNIVFIMADDLVSFKFII